jgi:hypothetical protein
MDQVPTGRGQNFSAENSQNTDLVFGKAMAMDIGMTNGDKVYVLSYLADPA